MEGGNCRVELSFENTKRLLERKYDIQDTITSYIERGYRESRDQLNKELNKKLYEMAEQANMSLWDLCFSVVPRMEIAEQKYDINNPMAQRCNIEYEVMLEPMPLEFEQGPGYWKGKYFKLKQQIQKLIDSKEE